MLDEGEGEREGEEKTWWERVFEGLR